MIFERNNNKYRIMFKYGPKEDKRRYMEAIIDHRETVTTPDGAAERWVPIAVGLAKCNPLDRFVCEEGRIISLRKATEGIDHDMKRAVWDAYTNRRKLVKN